MDHPHRPVEAHMCSRKGRIASLKAHGRFTELVLMSRIHDKRDENTLDNTRTLLDQTWEQVTGPSQTRRFDEAVSQGDLKKPTRLTPPTRHNHQGSRRRPLNRTAVFWASRIRAQSANSHPTRQFFLKRGSSEGRSPRQPITIELFHLIGRLGQQSLGIPRYLPT
ncbi:hypothetical protein HYQ46_012920 [Verticillium longisporum]|nr:hypothetical protein HYQ46_012920 [Verticillium longisporum]